MSAPLQDLSDGALKAWPGGYVLYPDGRREECFRPAAVGEHPVATVLPASDQPVYCKYCYKDTLPLTLREEVIPGRVTNMTICSQCAYGLTPPEDVT